jgi:uncharacterized membrane protein YidH (DUF202 family)
MFKLLFEQIIGKNADPVYTTDVFPTVGLFTMIFTLIVALIFYLLLGRWRPVWEKLSHWIATVAIISLAAGFFAISHAMSATGEGADSYMYSFSMMNALYAVVFFVIFSLLLKRASIFARRTPF